MDGLLLVDKPSGPTSHDVVERMRIALGEPTYLNDMKLMTRSAAQAAAAGSDKGRAELTAAFKSATELTQAGK